MCVYVFNQLYRTSSMWHVCVCHYVYVRQCVYVFVFIYIYIYIYICVCVCVCVCVRMYVYMNLYICPWCKGYHRRKWTGRHEFKSWTRLIAFHIALIPLWKVWIELFSLQLWVNSRADCVLQPWWGNYSRRRKTLN